VLTGIEQRPRQRPPVGAEIGRTKVEARDSATKRAIQMCSRIPTARSTQPQRRLCSVARDPEAPGVSGPAARAETEALLET